METIQVVLSAKLRRAADVAAKRQKVNRSALVRTALAEHLERLRIRDLEEQDRRGYLAKPPIEEELQGWEEVEAWPED